MSDKVIFQDDGDGDLLNEENLAKRRAVSNQSDYVERGLAFTADYANLQLDVGSGHAVVRDGTRAYDVFPIVRDSSTEHGSVQLVDSTVNEIYLVIDPGTDDEVSYSSIADGSTPSNPYLKVGEVDTSADTMDQDVNRDPAVSTRSIDTDELTTKKQPVANVKAWGATGDGSTNDTQAIRDALAYLKQNNGGCLFFPAGTYVVCENPSPEETFDLSDKPNIEICGVGYASHIKAKEGVANGSDNGVIIFYGGKNADIHDIRVDGTRSTQGTITDASDGANFVQTGANTNFTNVWSINSTGDGVETFGDDCKVHDCTFRNNEEQDVHVWGSNTVVSDNLCIGNQEDGALRVYTSGTKRGDVDTVKFTDNVVINTGSASTGIQIAQDNATTTNAQITGNTVLNSGNHGILTLTAGSGLEIRDNTIVDATKDAIRVAVDSSATTNCVRPRIVGNSIRNPTNGGIIINTPTSVTYAVDSPRVEENDVYGAGASCCEVINTDDPRVDGNTFEGAQEYGMNITSAVALSRVRIRDNDVIDNNQAGSSFDAIATFANDATIDTLIIRDNEIDSTGTPQHQQGTDISAGGTGSYSSVYLRDNSCLNQAASSFGIADKSWYAVCQDNHPTEAVDVRALDNIVGNRAYHDGSGTNTEGEAQYIDGAAAWKSLVDGTTIS